MHLVDNESLRSLGKDGHDNIGKVWWLLEYFSAISKANYNCEVTCTIDKIMLPYEDAIVMYMKGKPIKFGIKIWTLASS